MTQNTVPEKLTLCFSKAADHSRINAIFRPEIKTVIDPGNFVVKREPAIFDAAIAEGRAAFLSDHNTHEVHGLTMAWRLHNGSRHLHTEIGTSLARASGFGLGQLAAAAMALKEWQTSPPSGLIVAEILPDNVPSLKTYRDKLRWPQEFDHQTTQELHVLCNQSIDPQDKGRPTIWFRANDSIPHMARYILGLMDTGVLRNKHDDEIVIDLETAFNEIGLDRQRLAHIAEPISKAKSKIPAKPPAPELIPAMA